MDTESRILGRNTSLFLSFLSKQSQIAVSLYAVAAPTSLDLTHHSMAFTGVSTNQFSSAQLKGFPAGATIPYIYLAFFFFTFFLYPFCYTLL